MTDAFLYHEPPPPSKYPLNSLNNTWKKLHFKFVSQHINAISSNDDAPYQLLAYIYIKINLIYFYLLSPLVCLCCRAQVAWQ